MKPVLFLLLVLVVSINSGCIGVPLSIFDMKSFNCRSLCCVEGYVQDLITGTNCIPCDSVGLIGCASCALYAKDESGSNYTYRCLRSKNIEGLITVGSASQCAGPGQVFENTYVLNNWTNFNACVPCDEVIPDAKKCQIQYSCNLTVSQNIGNDCKPRVTVIECQQNRMIGSIDATTCETCFDLIYGCVTCEEQRCTSCDSMLNLTVSEDGQSCECTVNTTCNLCQSFSVWNGTDCHCISGYQNVNGSCVLEQLCDDPNQVFNPINVSCQCKIGYSLNASDLCHPITCGNNSVLTKAGVCECDNGYTLVNASCILLGSYPTRSHNYDVILNTTLNVTVTTQDTYTCGCPAGFRIVGEVCVPCSFLFTECPCPEGWVFKNGTCQTCDAVGATDCMSCERIDDKQKAGAIRYDWCNRCNPGFYIYQFVDASMSRCEECLPRCSECMAVPKPGNPYPWCSACYPGNFFLERQTSCYSCSRVDPNCMQCGLAENSNTAICLYCKPPYVIDGTKCKCPNPANNNTEQCINCQVGCLVCENQHTCFQCKPGMVLFNNSCRCQSLSLTVDNDCEGCKSDLTGRNIQGCILCGSATTCNVCQQGYLLINGNCEMCTRFINGCLKCSNTTVCTECDAYLRFELSNGTCVCQSLVTYEVNGICRNCTEMIIGCSECSDINTCTKCNETTHFTSQGGKCNCTQGYFLVELECVLCQYFLPGCETCETQTECRFCMLNYVKTENGSCVCNYAAGMVQTPGGCMPCAEAFHNCTQCNEYRCTECDDYWELNVTTEECSIIIDCPFFMCSACTDQRCVLCTPPTTMNIFGSCNCPPFTMELNGTCQECTANHTCRKCRQINNCDECADEHIMKWWNGTCSCPTRMYYDPILETCRLCPGNCKQCLLGETSPYCTECDAGKNRMLNNGSCDCMEGYHSIYPNDKLQDNTACVEDEVEESEEESESP